MGPKEFLQSELVPVVEGIKKRGLINLEEEFKIEDDGIRLRMSLVSGGFKYLKGFLDNYIFPKLFAHDVEFERYAFGEVTNLTNIMYLEVVISFRRKY